MTVLRFWLLGCTYGHDERRENNPAGLPPQTGPVADHFLNVVVELIHACKRTLKHRESIASSRNLPINANFPLLKMRLTVEPRNGNALEEDEEEQTHPAG